MNMYTYVLGDCTVTNGQTSGTCPKTCFIGTKLGGYPHRTESESGCHSWVSMFRVPFDTLIKT